jgi:hypothetical protein
MADGSLVAVEIEDWRFVGMGRKQEKNEERWPG